MNTLLNRLEPTLNDLEETYRHHYLPTDMTQVQIFALVMISANLIFAPVDYALLRDRPLLLLFTLVLRTAIVLLSLGYIFLIKRAQQPTTYDRLVLGYMLMLGSMQGFSAATRPSDYYGSFLFDIVLVLCCYVIIPTTLFYRITTALVATLTSLIMLFFIRESTPIYWSSVPIALFGAHVIGLISSTRAATYRRHEYRAIHETRQLNQQLTILAETDALTGAYNRRKFMELGAMEFARFQRYGHGFALLLADVDFFKRVNDQYGHAAGDAVLTSVAQLIQTTKRTPDQLGRLGGEEFALLIPETTLANAQIVAERIRTHVEAASIATPAGAVQVTLSAGLIEISSADPSFDAALQRADQLLYRAKNLGRNRIEA
jgi:diguanylate cyclase (GGDEF)-like protein